MRIKTKGIIKKIALVLAGVVALSAVGFGVAKLVEFVKDDLKTINPVFDVGNLGTDGKFVDDESTLYTKEAFQCDGLQIKLDFDNQIEYQIYFYDDLDNFVESTEVLSAAYSETVHDGYARIVIMPTNDEDEKISLTERVTYPGQMTIKVAKEQNVEYINVFNKRLRVISDKSLLRFYNGMIAVTENGSYEFVDDENYIITSGDILEVDGGSSIRFNYAPDGVSGTPELFVYEFSIVDGKLSMLMERSCVGDFHLSEDTEFVVFRAAIFNDETELFDEIPDYDIKHFSSFITISK